MTPELPGVRELTGCELKIEEAIAAIARRFMRKRAGRWKPAPGPMRSWSEGIFLSGRSTPGRRRGMIADRRAGSVSAGDSEVQTPVATLPARLTLPARRGELQRARRGRGNVQVLGVDGLEESAGRCPLSLGVLVAGGELLGLFRRACRGVRA